MEENPAFATLVQEIQNLEYKAQEEPLDMLFDRLSQKFSRLYFRHLQIDERIWNKKFV